MKKLFIVLLFSASILSAQFKDELNKPVDIKSGVYNKNLNSLFSLFGIQDFSMNHSFGMSFSTFGAGSYAIGSYTNSMKFTFSDKLNLKADFSIINSPYSSFGKDFANQINGVYIDRIQMNYKVSDNMSVKVQYSNNPFNYYSSFYSGYSPFYRNNFLFGDPFGND